MNDELDAAGAGGHRAGDGADVGDLTTDSLMGCQQWGCQAPVETWCSLCRGFFCHYHDECCCQGAAVMDDEHVTLGADLLRPAAAGIPSDLGQLAPDYLTDPGVPDRCQQFACARPVETYCPLCRHICVSTTIRSTPFASMIVCAGVRRWCDGRPGAR